MFLVERELEYLPLFSLNWFESKSYFKRHSGRDRSWTLLSSFLSAAASFLQSVCLISHSVTPSLLLLLATPTVDCRQKWELGLCFVNTCIHHLQCFPWRLKSAPHQVFRTFLPPVYFPRENQMPQTQNHCCSPVPHLVLPVKAQGYLGGFLLQLLQKHR